MARRTGTSIVAAIGAMVTVAAVLVATPAAGAVDSRPTAAVAIGDSYLSGESAGSYEPGSDRPGNFCHRSTRAEIQRLTLPVDKRINLACSGASTDNVRLGGTALYGEKPQADQLRAVARDNRVKLIVVSIGGNDAQFVPLVLDCVKAYFRLAGRCQDKWATKLPGELTKAAPKIGRALTDIKAVMRDAGYADTDYQLILQSYPSPITGDNRYVFTKVLQGCPIRDDDAAWARNIVVDQFMSTMSQVATQQKVRFLGMAKAFYGHEKCAEGIGADQEWATGISIDVTQLRNGLGGNIVQQSLHPNALGHQQFGTCLSAFATLNAPAALCVSGANRSLEPRQADPRRLAAPVRARTLPVEYEPAPIEDEATARRLEAQRTDR